MSQNKETTLKHISEDRALASAMLFPHRHRQASPSFHISIMDMWRASDPFVSIEAFREGAKSTLSEEFLCLELLFGNMHYGLIFGETWTKACQRLEAIKYELQTNMRIYNLFGKQTGKGFTWSENKIVLPNGGCLEAHGWEEEIRGYKHLQHRPDRAYLDDIENKERVRDTQTVDGNWKRIFTELIPAMDTELGKLRMTGTPLADDCIMTRARSSPNFVNGMFPICDRDIDDPEAVAAWPERYPMEWIRAKRDMMAAEGLLAQFMQEYMLVPTGQMGKPFVDENFVFEDVAPRMYAPRKVIIDPARTTDIKKSDQTGRVVISKIGTRIYVHESEGAFLKPDAVVSSAFDASARNDDCDVHIEKNSLDEWLLQPMRAKMLETGQMVSIKPMNAPQDRDKDQFIMGLQPFFEAKDVVFVGGRQKHPRLISQLLNFPSGLKDVLNALAYAPRVYSGIPIYGDFSDRNIIDGYSSKLRTGLLFSAHSTGTETCAVLCDFDGDFLTILADWVSPLLPGDAIPSIAKLVRSTFPARTVSAWIPGDAYDQVGRNPLLASLKDVGWRANRSEYSQMLRGSLSSMLRTEMRGRRFLTVDSNARHVMQAMAQGYNWPVKSGGERGSEPERGPARTLMEALECLTFAINRQDNAPKPAMNSTNQIGVPYWSALPRRK